MNLRICYLALLIAQHAFGAFEKTSQGGRTIAMGGASVSLPRDPWASFANPGVLPTIDQRFFSLSYSPQFFGLKELARGSMSFVEPTSIGTFGISGQRFGFDLYREVTASVSYGRTISDLFQVGGSINYYSLTILNYGSAGAIGVDLGGLMQISDQVWWGVAAFNLNAPTIGKAKERLPQQFSTGVTYFPLPSAIISLAIVKDIRYAAELQLGVEYTVFPGVDIRGGVSGEPSTLNVGMGLQYSFIRMDYAFTEHPDLGVGHQISLSLALGEL